MAIPIKYLDLEGLKSLYGVVDGKITTAVTNAKGELKDNASAEYDTLGKLEGKIKAEESRATTAESALVSRLDTVEDQIVIIKGEGEGSIKKAASDAVAKVVAGAPENFDTLKEVAEWIGNDTTGAAQMQSDIAMLKGGKDVEGSVANSIDKAVNTLDATVGGTTIAVGNHVAVEVVQTDGKLTGLTVSENDIASAATLGTVKSAQEKNTALLEGIPTAKKVKGYVDEAVAAAKAAATTKVAKAADAAHLTVTKGDPAADGSVTYTISESNIASADDLTTETNRAKAAEDKIEASVGLAADGSFTAPAGNYINGAATVMDAVEKLDVRAKANADKIDGMSVDEVNQTVTIDSKGLQFVAITAEEIQDAANK